MQCNWKGLIFFWSLPSSTERMEDASDSSRYKTNIGWLLYLSLLNGHCWICIKATFQKSTYFSILPVINTTRSVKGKNRNKVQSLTSAFQFRTAVCQHHKKSIVEMTLIKNSEKGILGKTMISYFIFSMFPPSLQLTSELEFTLNCSGSELNPLHIITLTYTETKIT